LTGELAPGLGQESGHVFGLEPTNDPHFDHTPGVQAMHSKDNTIASTDSELGFDPQTNKSFPSPTYDVMHQVVCGCPNDEVVYNTWDWEYLRNHFVTFSSTGPTTPATFMTDVSPSVAGVGSDVYFIAKRSDGRIFYNRAQLGSGGQGYQEMEGNGLSASAPSAAAVGSHLFVGIEGQDQNLYLNQADDRQPFGSWQTLKFRSDVAPGLAAVSNAVFIFAKGVDRRIYLNQAVLGHGGSGWFEVQGNGRTDAAPALAAVNQSVFIFAKGRDKKIYVNQAVVGHGGSGWFEVQGGGLTDAAPAAGSVSDHLFVAIKNLDRRLLVNQAVFGHPFGAWFP
jgi:hypothetical protein